MRTLASIKWDDFDLVSTDIFDTLILRDYSLYKERISAAADLFARRTAMYGIASDMSKLAELRYDLHKIMYRAVDLERRTNEVAFEDVARIISYAVCGDHSLAESYKHCEIEVEAQHLRANRSVVRHLNRLLEAGKRIIAMSDSFYSANDLSALIGKIVEDRPISVIYSSADLNQTKHAGGMFQKVAELEGVAPKRILHFGDSYHSDVLRARQAGFEGVHLPRSGFYRISRAVGSSRAVAWSFFD